MHERLVGWEDGLLGYWQGTLQSFPMRLMRSLQLDDLSGWGDLEAQVELERGTSVGPWVLADERVLWAHGDRQGER
jgi:hypothetical protein